MMKIRLFIALCLVFVAFASKGQVKTFADLQQGDWLELECITFFHDSVPGDIWRAENIGKVKFRGTVIQKSKKEISFSFRPLHLYRHNDLEASYECYDSDINESDDSYKSFPDRGYTRQDFIQALEKDSFVISVQLPEVDLKDSIYALQADAWCYSAQCASKGLRGHPYWFGGGTIRNEDARLVFSSVLGYLYQWKQCINDNKGMPEIVNLSDNIPGFTKQLPRIYYSYSHLKSKACSIIRLVNTSSGMRPNMYLNYTSRENLQSPLTFTILGQKYAFSKEVNGQVCRFYLSSPSKININGVNLLLTPGDSLHIEKDESGVFSFSGKGAENCMFAQEEQKLLRAYRSTYDEKLETRIGKMSGIYGSLWDKHRDKMSSYWLKSSQLSYKYWYISSFIENRERPGFRQPGIPIPWDDPQFISAAPYVDYFYQPDNYDRFVGGFFSYKLEQIQSDNMTGLKGSAKLDLGKSNYYIQKLLFSGYPRLLLMKNSLTALMQRQHYSSYQAEYADFMNTCREPEMQREIYTLHQQLLRLEPGRNIQDVNPELAKLPFLKDKADGYIMLNVKNRGYAWDLTWTSSLWKSLKGSGLSDQVKVVALRPNNYTESLPDSMKNPNKYLYLANDNKMKVDEDFLGFFTGELILIRNDGTIVYREFAFGNDFGNLVHIIRADMEVRDHKPEPSHETLWWVLLAILFTGIAVAAIATLRVRLIRRREKNKRKITELELKAIRSQMNPHFVFNALGSIQSLINQGKSDEANHYLVNFAKLLRMVLSSSEKKLVSLSGELEQLDLYLRLEQLRVPFTYDISAYSNVHPTDEEIPGMLIQPVVENAVIHGIVPKQGGHISVRIRKENNILFVDITDNGVGIADEALKKNSFGIRAINERLALLNDEMKTSIGLEIENRLAKEGVSGTRVTISIPV